MASVKFGGRVLVARDITLGDLDRRIPAYQEAVADAETLVALRKTAALIFSFIEGNTGVTLEWVEDHLPVDHDKAVGVLKTVLAAAGGKEQAPQGEAPGQ